MRATGDAEFWFLINHTGEPVELGGVDGQVLYGEADDRVLGPHGVRVLRRPR
ncbi:Beta-galactosidase C-terminal domain [Actinoallomurus acanthiterrae]